MDHYGSPNENCATLKQWFTNFSLHQTHQEGLLKKRWLDSNQLLFQKVWSRTHVMLLLLT